MNAGRLGVVFGAGLVILGLAVLGRVLSPPEPESRQAGDLDPADPPLAESVPVAAGSPTQRTTTRIKVRGTEVEATVIAPATPGRHPAVVFAGAGLGSGIVEQAEFLARAGVVALTYDKRSVGYSIWERDYALLAEDALAAVAVLRGRADVDPAKVGLWGLSEGGWVAPIAADRDPAVAFVILASSTNVSPLRQTLWIMNEQLHRLRAPEGVRRVLAKAVAMAPFDYVRYDTGPALRGTRQPVLALYGTADAAVPLVDSVQVLTTALDQSGNGSYTIRFFAGADHGLRVKTGEYAPGYLNTMAHWITGLPSTARPPEGARIAGPAPAQRYEAREVPASPWYATGIALAVSLGLAAAGYLAGPAVALAGRLRRGRSGQVRDEAWAVVRTRLVRLVWGGVASVVSLNVFFGLIAAFALLQSGSPLVVQGSWIAVRLIAVLLAVLEVVTVAAAVSALRGGWRPGPAQWAALIGVTGGTGLLLLNSAYFGLFTWPW